MLVIVSVKIFTSEHKISYMCDIDKSFVMLYMYMNIYYHLFISQ